MVGLRMEDELKFVAGSSELPFSEVLRFRQDRYGLEEARIRRWLDAASDDRPISSSHIRREARKLDTRKKYKDWQKAYRVLRREKPGMTDVWYSRQIARSGLGGGHRPDTIRKNMKK